MASHRAPPLVVTAFTLACLLLTTHLAAAALPCPQVLSYIAPCTSYAVGRPMPPACCTGVRGVVAAAKTTADRQQTCTCLKSVAAGYTMLKPSALPTILAKCSVSIPYAVSPVVDCSRVK